MSGPDVSRRVASRSTGRSTIRKWSRSGLRRGSRRIYPSKGSKSKGRSKVMCRVYSCIVTRTGKVYGQDEDPSHTEIARRHNLPEDGKSEEHTSELQSRENLVCRLLLEKKIINYDVTTATATYSKI